MGGKEHVERSIKQKLSLITERLEWQATGVEAFEQPRWFPRISLWNSLGISIVENGGGGALLVLIGFFLSSYCAG